MKIPRPKWSIIRNLLKMFLAADSQYRRNHTLTRPVSIAFCSLLHLDI
jgi:hypothetical protein